MKGGRGKRSLDVEFGIRFHQISQRTRSGDSTLERGLGGAGHQQGGKPVPGAQFSGDIDAVSFPRETDIYQSDVRRCRGSELQGAAQ